jgi:hypothetical protein
MTNYRRYSFLLLEGLQGVAYCGSPQLRLVIQWTASLTPVINIEALKSRPAGRLQNLSKFRQHKIQQTARGSYHVVALVTLARSKKEQPKDLIAAA